jgi:hypothetical protein
MSEKVPSLFAAVIDRKVKNGRYRTLPLHVALSPLFNAPKDLDSRSREKISDIVGKRNAFWVAGMEEGIIGNDTRIRMVGGSVLYLLHERIMPVVKKLDPTVDRGNTGDEFKPHVAYVGNIGLEEGIRKNVQEITLFQQVEETWFATDHYPFKEPSLDQSSW